MTNIFKVEETKSDLQRGTYRLNNDLYAGFKQAANNSQMYLAMEYLVQMMEIINEKLNDKIEADKTVPDEAEQPKAVKQQKAQKAVESVE